MMRTKPAFWTALVSALASVALYLLTNNAYFSRFLLRLASPARQTRQTRQTIPRTHTPVDTSVDEVQYEDDDANTEINAEINAENKRVNNEKKDAYDALSVEDRTFCSTMMPSILHAVISVILALAACLKALSDNAITAHSSIISHPDESPSSVVSTHVSGFSYATLGFSFAYFVTDASVVCRRRISGPVILVHHLMTATGMAAGLLTGIGHVLTCVLVMNEITTPFVNARWLLDKAGNKESSLYVVNGVVMAVTWFIARILVFVPCFICAGWAWRDTRGALSVGARSLLFVVPAFLLVLNLHWFSRILAGLRKHLTKRAYASARPEEQHKNE